MECKNSIKNLLVDKSLQLQDPQVFFKKYIYNDQYEFYINERGIVHVKNINNNNVIDIFLKCVLRKYLKDNEATANEKERTGRFNTCPFCGKLNFNYYWGRYFFASDNNQPNPFLNLIDENLNRCGIYNHWNSNPLRVGDKFQLRIIDIPHVQKFFTIYKNCQNVKLYWCIHENISVYHKYGRLLDIYSEKDLFYYVDHFLKQNHEFNQCPDCDRISVNRKNESECIRVKCQCFKNIKK